MATSRLICWLGYLLSLALLLGQGTRANADMVTPVIIDATHNFEKITTDGVNLYIIAGNPNGTHTISSLPIGRGTLTTLYSDLTTPTGITTLGSDVVWIDANSGPITDKQILKAPKTGGGPITAIYTGALVGQPIVDGSGITTDGTRLYTTDEVQGRVHRLNPDGSDLTQLGGNRYGGFFDREHTNSIAVNDGIVYIAD
jgi:hypothetical protein